MAESPCVSILIPVYNKWELTRDCLVSLDAMRGGRSFEVLLVDNASTDATASQAPDLGHRLFGDDFHYLRQEENLGFSRANNLAARSARGEFLYLLNNDTAADTDPLSAPVRMLESDDTLGAAGPLLVYPGGERVQHLGIAVAHGIKSVHLYHLYPADHPVVSRARRLQAITMAAFCVRRSVYLELDGLHEGYVNGMEDIDFCARLGERGLACGVTPEAVVRHIAGQSEGRHAQEAHNSRLLSSRCSQRLRPDMNLQAGADGYALRLTPWLDPYLALGPDRERAILDAWEACPEPDALPELLNREPCWDAGWDLLADHYGQQGDLAWKLAVLRQKSAFVPTPDTFDAMKETAFHLDDLATLSALARQDEQIGAAMDRPASLRAQARGAMRRAGETGNPDMVRILDHWLDDNFGEDDS